MINVMCVLRSGGDYEPSDVAKLAAGIDRNLMADHRMICCTDYPVSAFDGYGGLFTIVPLEIDPPWPGWWSKMELFRQRGPVLYFDLDTVITGSIDDLAAAVAVAGAPFEITMLRGFYRDDICSGVMGWSGDLSWVTDAFQSELRDKHEFIDRSNAIRLRTKSGMYRGDQEWLVQLFKNTGTASVVVQDLVPGVCSYKVDVQPSGKLPADTRVVCFHGRPRPHDVGPGVPWLEEHWRL